MAPKHMVLRLITIAAASPSSATVSSRFSPFNFNPYRVSLPLRYSSYPAPLDRASSSPPPAPDLCITDSCVKRLQLLKRGEGGEGEGKMLRVSVEGGGCSGFQYMFTLDDKFGGTDRIFEKDGVKIVVDEISLDFIKGATIDYAEELIRSSFMVTQNPNASGGCGCGSSFNVK